MPQLYLIDGSSQMYRAYHAFRGRGLTNQEGHTTHAVYVFVTMLRKLMNDHHPEYIAASFDLAGPTFRKDLAADYKANRAPMPPDLAEQIPWVHQACEALGVPVLTSERFEADDVIGTLTAQGANYKVLEFHGDTIRNMPTSGRLVLCNMTVEAGATGGIGKPDSCRW